jgi:DMSO/TMAO reductase YedYZ molybdopterin-dependent catalytic subunit
LTNQDNIGNCRSVQGFLFVENLLVCCQVVLMGGLEVGDTALAWPAPGTRPEYTPIKDHYKVFIRTEPTVIDGSTWVLPITGLVDNPLMLTLDDLKNNCQPRDQYVTLSCISGRIGTSLISTTQWTRVSVQDILADLQVQPEARYLYITSGDGFYETVDLELIGADERIMLCYA